MVLADFWHSHHWIDPRDWLGVIATVAAAVLAYRAIQFARNEANQSAADLLAERRADHDLSILRELAQGVGRNGSQSAAGALLDMTSQPLPITRGAFGAGTQEDGAAYETAFNGEVDRRKGEGDPVVLAIEVNKHVCLQEDRLKRPEPSSAVRQVSRKYQEAGND